MLARELRTGLMVIVKDHRLYQDDATPLEVMMQPAVVVRKYRKGGTDLVDVRFDRDGFVSRGHNCLAISDL